MAKQSGLGQNFYVGGYDISGDVVSLDETKASQNLLENTGIDKRAMERVSGLLDGSLKATAWWNPASGQEHTALGTLGSADKHAMYCIQAPPAIGSWAACLVGKQASYDGKREDSSAYTLDVEMQGNAYGLEWGQLLTAGKRTDSTATSPSTGLDTLSSQAHGLQAYLQVFAFAGTSVTIKLQDSADNSSFTDIASGAFATVSSAPQAQRIAIADGATVRRYVRVVTTGTFSNAVFAVSLVKNFTTVTF